MKFQTHIFQLNADPDSLNEDLPTSPSKANGESSPTTESSPRSSLNDSDSYAMTEQVKGLNDQIKKV